VSVLVVLRVPADAEGIKRATEENRETFLAIADRAKGRGAIHHAFYAGDGEVLIVDEWDSAESFQSFFQDESPNIGPLMEAGGAQGEPEARFYEKLSLGDEF
jgi:hypothetical protein